MGTTTIEVKDSTHKRLWELKQSGVSMDEIVNQALDALENGEDA